MELDHVLSRSRHPELTFDEQNLKPSCHDCNYAKGSLSLEEYLEKKERMNYEWHSHRW